MKNADSMTKVNFGQPRVCFSVRISADLKKRFTETVKAKKLSTCFIVETLLSAWLEGLKVLAKAQSLPVDTHPYTITIHQTFQRVVKRVRRKGLVEEYLPETNRWKADIGWYFDAEFPNDGGVLDYHQRKSR